MAQAAPSWAANDAIVGPAPAMASGSAPPWRQIVPPEPSDKTSYRLLTPQEAAAQGLDPKKRWQMSSEGHITALAGEDGTPADAKLQEAERTAAFLTTRVLGGIQDIQSVTKKSPDAAKPEWFASFAGLFGDEARNWANSPERRQVEAAQLEILDAALTLGTGAAYTKEQLENYRQTYFPKLTDDKDTVEGKRNRLLRLLAAARLKAGNAAPQVDEAIKSLGGDPKATAGPGVKPPLGPGDIGFNYEGDPRGDPMTPEQQTAYDSWWKANPNPTPEQLEQFAVSLTGKKPTNAKDIVDAVKEGRGVAPGAAAVYAPLDITDMRKGDEVVDPIARGVADTVTLGLSDELAAGVDTLTGKGSYTENLARERAIAEYDQENNFWLRTGGQVAGGFALPLFGARTPAELAKVGAKYGAVYGAGSSESFAEVPGNAAVGGAVGAAAAWGGSKLLEKLSRKASPAVPDLVDPVTGRLNEPLEAAGPAARVAAGQKFGIDMPMGAAGDRSAKIIEKGLDNVPGSAGVMNDSRRIVEGQVSEAAEGVADRFGSARTLFEAGDAAQRGAKSWISRFEDVSRKVYDAIPISPKASSTLNNTRTALTEMTSIFDSNPKLADLFKNTRLSKYLEALDPDQGGSLSWNDIKALRSRIGEEIGDQRFSDSPMKSELRRLYGALSEDMRLTAAAQGPAALRKFERANNLYREGQGRIDTALVKILGDDSKLNPEAASAAVQTIARSGKGSGNLKQLADIRASLVKSGDWDEVASSLIRLGGQPAKSEGRTFDPAVFVRWYADMTEPARNLLFGGANKELRKNLDEFVAVNQRLSGTNALRNTSNTVPVLTGAGIVTGAGLAVINPLLGAKLAVGAVANYGMGRLWTSPRFVKWATGYTKMLKGAAKAGAAPSATGTARQVKLLERVAVADPAITQEALGLRQLLLGANDNTVPGLAASPDSDEQQQQ